MAPSSAELEQHPQVRRLLLVLRERAGGYLRNVDRTPGVTCQVCCTPIARGERCRQCDGQQSRLGADLADLVLPVVYGGHNDQARRLFYGYKEPGSEKPGDERRTLVQVMFTAVSLFHSTCIVAASGGQLPSATVTVPSTKQRADHPLPKMTTGVFASLPRISATAAPEQPPGREVARGRFHVAPSPLISRQHVIIIDDTWTTGARTQSMALDLRDLGATRITILVLARWLGPGWPPTDEYLTRHKVDNYDPRICPVTGEACPA